MCCREGAKSGGEVEDVDFGRARWLIEGWTDWKAASKRPASGVVKMTPVSSESIENAGEERSLAHAWVVLHNLTPVTASDKCKSLHED